MTSSPKGLPTRFCSAEVQYHFLSPAKLPIGSRPVEGEKTTKLEILEHTLQSHLSKGKSPPTNEHHLILHVLHKKLNVSLFFLLVSGTHQSGFPSPDYFVD